MTSQEINNFIVEIRKNANKNHIPVLREKTADLFAKYIKQCSPKRILEIGTSVGSSGIICLNNCNGHLTTVEIEEDVQQQAKTNFAHCNLLDRVEFILGDCMEVVFFMQNNSYDFMLLDGPKSHYLELYKMLLPLLEGGGTIFVDNIDYKKMLLPNGEMNKKHRTIVRGLQSFLDYVHNDKTVKATFHDIDDGVLVIKKIV